MRYAGRIGAVLVLALTVTTTPAAAQAPCALSPVFALFRQVAGADVVGECKEPATVSEQGDVTQATTRGLAAYRYADQVIAFTDGRTTWLYGPEGLQKRGASERFAWEQLPAQAAVSAATSTPA